MNVYLSHASLQNWADAKTLYDGKNLFLAGNVSDLEMNEEMIYARVTIHGRPFRTRFRILRDGHVESHCPCRATQNRGVICTHVTAAGFMIADLTEDLCEERRKRIRARRERPLSNTFVQRRPPDFEGAVPAEVRLRLEKDWPDQWQTGAVQLTAQAVLEGARTRLDKMSTKIPLHFSEPDANLLYVLEDLAGTDSTPGRLKLEQETFLELLEEVSPGPLIVVDEAEPIEVKSDPHYPLLKVNLDPATGRLHLQHTIDAPRPTLLVGKKRGWAWSGKELRPLEAVLPDALRGAYAETGATIEREDTLTFLRNDLSQMEHMFLVETDIDESHFDLQPGEPAFEVELTGTPEHLEAHLYAIYGHHRVKACAPNERDHFPVPDQPRSFYTRDTTLEEIRLNQLEDQSPFHRQTWRIQSIEGVENVMKTLAEAVPDLRRQGWT
ncbi:MAG: hypothetical protein AAF492_06420, partial [Verrucomicrobiota bacterium]